MKKTVKKLILATSTLAVTTSLLVTPGNVQAQEGKPQGNNNCSQVYIINTSGTGGSHVDNKTDASSLAEPDIIPKIANNNFINDDRVSLYNIAYPSAAGAVASGPIINGAPGKQTATTYGMSRLMAVQQGINFVEKTITQCPDAAFVMTGYSQGAHVAGDITALLANGAVKGLDKDKIIGAILLADPGRASSAGYTGFSPEGNKKAWIPLPDNAKVAKNGELMTTNSDTTVGWTGQRSLPFTGIEGRVISICKETDMACSVEPNDPLRRIADVSDKNINPNKGYQDGSSLSVAALAASSQLLTKALTLLPIIATNDSFDPLFDRLNGIIDEINVEEVHKGTLRNAVSELRDVLKILKEDDAYGPNVTDKQIIAHLIDVMYPRFENMIPAQAKPIASQIIGAIKNSTPPVPQDVLDRVQPSLDKLYNFTEHGSYFNEHYQIGGVPAAQWAGGALVAGINNYLSGQAVAVPQDANNNNQYSPDSSRPDDGLNDLLKGNTPWDKNSNVDDSNNVKDTGDDVIADNSDNSNSRVPGNTYDGIINPDGTITLPDGTIINPDGSLVDENKNDSVDDSSKNDENEDSASARAEMFKKEQEKKANTQKVASLGNNPKVETGGKVVNKTLKQKIVSIFS